MWNPYDSPRRMTKYFQIDILTRTIVMIAETVSVGVLSLPATLASIGLIP